MDIIEELLQQIKNIEANEDATVNMMQKYGYNNLADTITANQNQDKLFHLSIKTLKELKVAVIMDPLTLESYRPECNIIELVPEAWEEQITEFAPHMVFIESVWHGKDKLWCRKVDRYSKELNELSDFCHEKNIPIVFWNKEDPVHTTRFMITATLADYVFTTDIDCIKRYKTELGHDRVYHLHFAAQPQFHNPIEKLERKDKFCFAGAYYHKYAKRAEVFDKFAKEFIDGKGLDIFDRNYKNASKEYAFPKQYNKYILGNLKPSEIDIAYKGYNYGVNMNSVQNSQSMFARRVFELLASNTVLVGNYSRGVKNYFGDLTISTEETETLNMMLDKYCQSTDILHKYRLLGLRKVLSEHLYEDRLDYIVQKVFGISLKRKLPIIVMLAQCNNNEELESILSVYDKQNYENKKLVIIGDNIDCSVEKADVYSVREASSIKFSALDGEYCTYIDVNDYYGKNYLYDMILHLRHGNYKGVGKNAYYHFEDGKFVLQNEKQIYKTCLQLQLKKSIISNEIVGDFSIAELCNGDREWSSDKFISVDEYNYCESYKGENCECVDDLFISNCGLGLEEIQRIAEGIEGLEVDEGEQFVTVPNGMAKNCGCFVTNKKVLVLSHHYPSKEALYNNMFVHKRVKAYRKEELLCEVMCMNNNDEECFREFEGIDIIQGGGQKLSEILESNNIETVCVHFLNQEMWDILKLYLHRINIIIWCHGSDIQPWWRREYLYKNDDARKQGELLTQQKMELWTDVFKESEHKPIHFVFVSQYFADIVMEDYKYTFSPEQYSIIHNYIDSDMFKYMNKSENARKKVISIRPYSGEVYANDIMVSTIVELSKRSCFKDMHFLVAGDGILFDKTVCPLKKYKNVIVHKGFYTQSELAKLYAEYGIVLIPSRGDTQGVSRDEAMSAGCVPITNPVMAIPEFVDETCAFLIEPENSVKMADAIENLYHDASKFEKMSEKAAIHVRKLSDCKQTIGKEIELIAKVSRRSSP